MDTATRKKIVRNLLVQAGTTYAEEAGIAPKDKPMPLCQLLALCMLASKPIDAAIGADDGELGRLAPRANAKLAAALVRVSLDDGLRDKVADVP